MSTRDPNWPALPLAEWRDTYATLHMWTQIVGKVRLALSPNINHFWGCTLYVTSRGLTTSAIPYEHGAFEVLFDFTAHTLEITTSRGEMRAFRLMPRTVAEFYAEFMTALESLGIHVKVWTMPVEVPRPVRFTLDEGHKSFPAVAPPNAPALTPSPRKPTPTKSSAWASGLATAKSSEMPPSTPTPPPNPRVSVAQGSNQPKRSTAKKKANIS
jgi:hypothetical protein